MKNPRQSKGTHKTFGRSRKTFSGGMLWGETWCRRKGPENVPSLDAHVYHSTRRLRMSRKTSRVVSKWDKLSHLNLPLLPFSKRCKGRVATCWTNSDIQASWRLSHTTNTKDRNTHPSGFILQTKGSDHHPSPISPSPSLCRKVK